MYLATCCLGGAAEFSIFRKPTLESKIIVHSLAVSWLLGVHTIVRITRDDVVYLTTVTRNRSLAVGLASSTSTIITEEVRVRGHAIRNWLLVCLAYVSCTSKLVSTAKHSFVVQPAWQISLKHALDYDAVSVISTLHFYGGTCSVLQASPDSYHCPRSSDQWNVKLALNVVCRLANERHDIDWHITGLNTLL